MSSSDSTQQGGRSGASTTTATSRGSDAAADRAAGSGSPRAGTAGGKGSAASSSAATTRSAEDAQAAAARAAAPRRVRLTVARVDPWSVMKLSFLLSVALGIALVVAAGVLWSILDGMGIYSDISRVIGEIIGDPSFDLTVWVGFGRTLSLVTVIAVVDVVLLTAIATLGAFLYNISAALVGGLHVTLSDD